MFSAARVGRKRGKMNLEKTMNKNMFNISSAIRNANPLAPPERIKTEHNESHDTPSTPLSSLLSHPKQKLATQFKRAITMIKQKSDPINASPSITSLPPTTQPTNVEKPFESLMLTSLTEESIHKKDKFDSIGHLSSSSTITTQSVSNIKSQPMSSSQTEVFQRNNNESNSPQTATVISVDSPINRTNNPNSPSARMVKQSLQQIHSSILQTMHQHHPLSPQTTTSSSATLSPTPTSSSTMGTGEVAILETIL